AKAAFEEVAVRSRPAAPRFPARGNHVPNFSVRKWLGGRQWVFDGKEPILQLPYEQKHTATYFTQTVDNVKLLPGYKPVMNWNGHWDIANQGAFPEGGSKATAPQVSGGGKTLGVSWTGKQYEGAFTTKTQLTIGFDPRRGTYTYNVDTELQVH